MNRYYSAFLFEEQIGISVPITTVPVESLSAVAATLVPPRSAKEVAIALDLSVSAGWDLEQPGDEAVAGLARVLTLELERLGLDEPSTASVLRLVLSTPVPIERSPLEGVPVGDILGQAATVGTAAIAYATGAPVIVLSLPFGWLILGPIVLATRDATAEVVHDAVSYHLRRLLRVPAPGSRRDD